MRRRELLRSLGVVGTALALGCEPQPATRTPAPDASAAAASPGRLPASGPRFNVKDHGATGDGSSDDAAAIAKAIAAAIAAGPGATVFFPQGRYLLRSTQRAQIKTPYPAVAGLSDLWAQRDAHVLVQGARGLTLLGDPGAVLVMTSYPAAGVLLERCADVTLRQFAIDWDPLPFTQGTIVALDPSAGTLDLRTDANFPLPTEERFRVATQAFGSVRGPRSPDVVKATAGFSGDVSLLSMAGITRVGPDLFRLPVVAAHLRGIASGDRFVLPARTNGNGWAIGHFFTERCTLDRVTVHSSPTVAFMAQHNEALTFRECVIEPLPGSGRLLSTNADGIHCKYDRRGPLVERCRFSGMHDDGFTFHSIGLRVLQAESANVLIVERNEFFRAGDEIAVIGQTTGVTRGTATIREAGLVRWRDRLAVRLVSERPVSGVVGFEALGETMLPANPESRTPLERRPDLVADLATLGSGFVVRDSVFARFRGGGRVYASDGKVEGNRFEQLSLHPIQLGMELFWPEVYHANRVSISNNTFVGNVGRANVRIQDLLGNFRPARTLGNREITIAQNRFEGYGPDGAIFVGNADGVSITGNTFAGAADQPAVTLGLARNIGVEATGSAPTVLVLGAETERASVRVTGPVSAAQRASAGFSGTQGLAQWRYRAWDGTRYTELAYDAGRELWLGAAPLYVARDRQHPGNAADSVRSWTADGDATVRIIGQVRRLDAGGDGVRAEIVHRNETIWTAEIAAGDATGVPHDVSRRVAKGDDIHFRVARRGNANFDATSWDPLIV